MKTGANSIKKRQSPRPISELADAVVDAALALGDSLDAIAMPELARAAGLAVGSLYRVAPSKQALAALIETQVRARFDAHVFAPFPARLDMQARFNLIFDRLAQFALKEPQAARYLASRPMGPQTSYGRAAHVFARDGSTQGTMRQIDGAQMVALTWGPIAALLLVGAFDLAVVDVLKSALWQALKA